jgi:hypothetical protein
MSSTTVVTAAILVFVVAALLYYQSQSTEAFRSYAGSKGGSAAREAGVTAATTATVPAFGGVGITGNKGVQIPFDTGAYKTQTPQSNPIAGRLFDPRKDDDGLFVPADLSKAPVTAPSGSVPLGNQRPVATPGAGTTTTPREATAQLKDLRELDNKITTWLDAASTKDREQPGSLTPQQNHERTILQGRLAQIREELGTGMITSTYKQVAAETLQLRKENAMWQSVSPSLDEIHEFGTGLNPDAFLSEIDYRKFFSLFTAGIQELQGVATPDPLQKVRLQQLQIMQQELADAQNSGQTPNIKVSAAKNYLIQMLKPDQPLPTLFSMEPTPIAPKNMLANNFGDIMNEIKDMEFTLTVTYDPATATLKRSLAALMDKLKTGEVSPASARSYMTQLREARSQASPRPINPSGGPGSGSGSNPFPIHPYPKPHPGPGPNPGPTPGPNPGPRPPYEPNNLIRRATTLCEQIGEAFPEDMDALGCRPVSNQFEAETVINTVCERLRYSVPSVTPEQFDCPRRNV